MEGEADIDPEGPNLQQEKEKEIEMKLQRTLEIENAVAEQNINTLVADHEKFKK